MKYLIFLILICYYFVLLLKKFIRVFVFFKLPIGIRFIPAFDFLTLLFFFSPFFLFFIFFVFLKFFLFPLYKFLKNFFILIIHRIFSFLSIRCIDLLFSFFVFLYRLYSFFFFGSSYHDSILKTLVQTSSIKKSELLKDFYLFGSSYLQNPEVVTQTSMFSSLLILNTLKTKDILQVQFLNFKQLLEYNQLMRSVFFFSDISKKSSVISFFQNKTVLDFFIFKKLKFFLFFYYSLLNFFRTSSLIFDSSLYIWLYKMELNVRNFQYSFNILLLFVFKYFELLRRASRFLIFDFYNDSFINYYYYLMRRYDLAFGLEKDSLKFKLKSFFNTSVLFPDAFVHNSIFSTVFFFRFLFSFLFVLVNFLVFSIFFFFFKLVQKFFFFGHFISFLSKTFNNFSFFVFLKTIFFNLNNNAFSFFSIKVIKGFRLFCYLVFYRPVFYFFSRNFLVYKTISPVFFIKTLFIFFQFLRLLFLFIFIYLQKLICLYIFFFFPFALIISKINFESSHNFILNSFLKLSIDSKKQELLNFSTIFLNFDKSIFNDDIKKRVLDLFSRFLSFTIIYYPNILYRRAFFLFYFVSRFYIYNNIFLILLFFPFFYLFNFLNSIFFRFFIKGSFLLNFFFFFISALFYKAELIFFKFIYLSIFFFESFFLFVKTLSNLLVFQLSFFFFYLKLFILKFIFYLNKLYTFLNFTSFLFIVFLIIKFIFIIIMNIFFVFITFFLIIFFLFFKFLFIFFFSFIFFLFLIFYYAYIFFFNIISEFLIYVNFINLIYYYIFVFSWFFSKKMIKFNMNRNFAFAQILSFLYLLRNNLKSLQIKQLKVSTATINRYFSDFEISKFLKTNYSYNLTRDSFFYEHSTFLNRLNTFLLYMSKISPELKTALILRKLTFISRNSHILRRKLMPDITMSSSLWSTSNLAQHSATARTFLTKKFPLNYKSKFVQLSVLKLPDKLINEFHYHNFLRQRHFKLLQIFRLNSELISPAFLYDKQFDYEFSFYPASKHFTLSSFTSNLFSLFFMNDRSFLSNLQFFRSIFSRKNLHFFYPDLDSISNFRGKFLRFSPLYRFFYLKRERFKYIFSYNLLDEISPFVFSIALNWLTYYRLLKALLFTISVGSFNSWLILRSILPRFNLSIIFLNLDFISLMLKYLKRFFILFILFTFLIFYFFEINYFILFTYFFLFIYGIQIFFSLFRISRIELLFSYFRPFSFHTLKDYLVMLINYFFLCFFPYMSYKSLLFRASVTKIRFNMFFQLLGFVLGFFLFYFFKIFILIYEYDFIFVFVSNDLFLLDLDLNVFFRLVIKFSFSILIIIVLVFLFLLYLFFYLFEIKFLTLFFNLFKKFISLFLFTKVRFFAPSILISELDFLIKISEYEVFFIEKKLKQRSKL